MLEKLGITSMIIISTTESDDELRKSGILISCLVSEDEQADSIQACEQYARSFKAVVGHANHVSIPSGVPFVINSVLNGSRVLNEIRKVIHYN